ncbi:hypothetical protein WQ57_11955 [Mesobacillus campisalis]|uniref:Uncharacterized protein n=1 Tax=Mesobacillus campisalis TaxID=1408103 RepID=A0A0M2SUQ8_9BACI|nr:hypothetical protein [Mesobacillus campisalis]KKK37883.1 hypothetical protein WQ57_11955 [Mesobacillus campisalis]
MPKALPARRASSTAAIQLNNSWKSWPDEDEASFFIIKGELYSAGKLIGAKKDDLTVKFESIGFIDAKKEGKAEKIALIGFIGVKKEGKLAEITLICFIGLK